MDMIDTNHIYEFLKGVLLFFFPPEQMIQMFKIKLCTIVLIILGF